MRHVIFLTLCLTVGLGVLAQGPVAGGTLVIATSQEARVLDPITYSAIAEAARMDLIFDSLLYRDPEGRTIPRLAKDLPEFIEEGDKVAYVFHLHEGVFFSDGQELTAEDVKYTFERMRDPEEASPQYGIVEKMIESVEVVDPYTVRFNMKAPTPLELITPFYRGIVCKDAREQMGRDAYARNPVGSGPFELVEWRRDDYMLLRARKDYWMKTPNLDYVKFVIVPEPATQVIRLLNNEVDICGVQSEFLDKVEEAENARVIYSARYHYTGLVFDMRDPPFDNPLVRRAVWHLVDRDAILQAARGKLYELNISPTASVVNRAWDFPEERWAEMIPEYDPEKGIALLEEAGYTGKPRFKITYAGLSIGDYPLIGELFQYYLAQADIEVEVHNTELGVWLDAWSERPPKTWDVILEAWGCGPDPDGLLFEEFYSRPGAPTEAEPEGQSNGAGYVNPDVDRWLLEARTTVDREHRRDLYIKAIEQIIQDLPHIWLGNRVGATGVNIRVHDYAPVPGYGEFTPIVTPFSNVWVED